MESLSAWGKVFQTRGKSESADFPPGCQTFLRAHGTFLRCQIRVQLGLETEIGFQEILRMILHHSTENFKTEKKFKQQLEKLRKDLLSKHYKPKNIEDTFKHVTQIEKNEA